jgi:uncharacterized membrane protein YbhN (UPF0104 family)
MAVNSDSPLDLPATRGGLLATARRFLPLAVSVLLLLLVFFQFQSPELWQAFGALDPLLCLWLALLVLLRVLLVSLRWQVLLRALGGQVGCAAALRLTYCGAFLNSLLPGSVAGDPYRIYMVAKSRDSGEGVPLSAAVTATLLDRFIGLYSLCLLCGLALPFLAPLFQEGEAFVSLLAACAAILAGGLLGGAALLLLDKLIHPRFQGRFARALRQLSPDLRGLAKKPGALLWIIGLSFLGHLSLAALFLVALDSLGAVAGEGLGGPFALLAIALPVTLAQMMPFSLNGWGVRELAAVSGFTLLGIAAPLALAASIAVGAMNSLALLPALLFLLKRGQRVQSLTSSPPSPTT